MSKKRQRAAKGTKKADAALAAALKKGSKDSKTYKKYDGMMNSFRDWIKDKNEDDEDDASDDEVELIGPDGNLLPKTIPIETIKAFLGGLCADREVEIVDVEDAAAGPSSKKTKKQRVCLSESHVSSHRSAIRHWHRENKVPLPETFDAETKDVLMGFKKKIAKLKQQGKMPQQEGKAALKFPAYVKLALKLMVLGPVLLVATLTSSGKSHVARYVFRVCLRVFCLLCVL